MGDWSRRGALGGLLGLEAAVFGLSDGYPGERDMSLFFRPTAASVNTSSYSGDNPEEIDTFERSSPLNEYRGDTGQFTISTSNPSEGSKHLRDAGSDQYTIYSQTGDGLPTYPDPNGQRRYLYAVDGYVENNDQGDYWIHQFGRVDANNYYQLYIRHGSTEEILIQKNESGSFSDLDKISPHNLSQGKYFRAFISYYVDSNSDVQIGVVVADPDGNHYNLEGAHAGGFDSRTVGWKYFDSDGTITFDWDDTLVNAAPAAYHQLASKDSANPVIAGTSGSSAQSYAGDIIEDPGGGTYYAYLKSSGTIYTFSSTDLTNWSEDGVLLDVSSSGWDSSKLGEAKMRYDPADSTYRLYYSGFDSNGVHRIGLATSSSPQSGFSKSSSNPLVEPADVTTHSYDGLVVSDFIHQNGTYYLYANANPATSGDPWGIVVFTGSDYTTFSFDSEIHYAANNSLRGNLVTGLNWYKRSDGYYAGTFAGGWTNVDAIREQAFRQREMFYARGENPTSMTPLASVAVDIDKPPSWSERRTYGGSLLKEQDGDWVSLNKINGNAQMLYWGHDYGVSGTGNTGYTGRGYWSSFPDVTQMETL